MTILATVLTLLIACMPMTSDADDWQCTPTSPDMKGPFYKGGAPVRNQVGEGYLLMGQVKSAKDCSPIPEAKIELWMAGPDGRYEDRWRAAVFSNGGGRYFYKTAFPGPYGGRPPHIHIRVTASGYKELVTQHYPQTGSAEAVFDLVLIPE